MELFSFFNSYFNQDEKIKPITVTNKKYKIYKNVAIINKKYYPPSPHSDSLEPKNSHSLRNQIFIIKKKIKLRKNPRFHLV